MTSMPRRFGVDPEHGFMRLTREVAAECGCRFVNDQFHETRTRQDVSGLCHTDRTRVLEEVIRFRGRLDGCAILLLDDVISTGASLRTASGVLSDAGAASVIPVALVHLDVEDEEIRRIVAQYLDVENVLRSPWLSESLRRIVRESRRRPVGVIGPAEEHANARAAAPDQREGHLWSTDFDGTLYEGSRQSARVSAEIIELIARWLASGGAFQILSAGSLRGLARDGHPARRFDLVPRVLDTLAFHIGETEAARRICAGFTLAMSGGGERYTVVRPDCALTDGQVRFDPTGSCLLTGEDAAAVRTTLEAYGLECLAADAPLGDGIEGVSAMFFRLGTDRSALPGRALANRLSQELAENRIGARVCFVREGAEGSRRIQRFDAFAAPEGHAFGKLRVAHETFPRHARVLYTADRADIEGDREVFRFARGRPVMEACEVGGPGDVIRAVNRALAGT
jgi:hypothetical protein